MFMIKDHEQLAKERKLKLGGQDEIIYDETDSLKIARAFRKAGRSLRNE